MDKIILCLYLFYGSRVYTQAAEKKYKLYSLPRQPQYFFKLHPNDEKIFLSFYDAKALGGGQNFILDLKLNKLSAIPGNADAVPDPSGLVLTSPKLKKETGRFSYGGFHFFSLKGIGKNSQPIYTETELTGKYQSLGILNDKTLRVLSDQNGLSIKDYPLCFLKKKCELDNSTVKKICPKKNFYGQLQLPVLSKDGTYFSSYDGRKKSSKVFKIKQDLSCELVFDSKFITGKMDFNYTNKKVVFFMSQNQENHLLSTLSNRSGSYRQYLVNIDSNQLKLYEMDLEELKPKAIHFSALKGDFYFPQFDRAGNIYSFYRENEKYYILKIFN